MAVLDVLIGPGKLYRAPLATANPDETTVGYGGTWTSWTDVGDLADGAPVSVNLGDEAKKIFGQQRVGPIKAARIKREPVITCTLLEHTVANLALLTGAASTDTAAGASQKAFSSVSIEGGSDLDLYKWGIEAFRLDTAGTKQPVRWFITQGYIMLAGEIQYDKNNETVIPVEIHVLEAETGAFGTIEQVTAPASS